MSCKQQVSRNMSASPWGRGTHRYAPGCSVLHAECHTCPRTKSRQISIRTTQSVHAGKPGLTQFGANGGGQTTVALTNTGLIRSSSHNWLKLLDMASTHPDQTDDLLRIELTDAQQPSQLRVRLVQRRQAGVYKVLALQPRQLLSTY